MTSKLEMLARGDWLSFASVSLASTSLALYRTFSTPAPPNPRKRPVRVKFGNVDVIKGRDYSELNVTSLIDPPRTTEDPYFWMRDDSRADPEVLGHLQAEQEYFERMAMKLRLIGAQGSQEKLYEEFRARLKETDANVPTRDDPYFFYSRTEEGRSYPSFYRKSVAGFPAGASARSPEEIRGKEELLLDENALAEGHEFCDVHEWLTSPSHELLGFAVDFTGDETYSVRFRRLDGPEFTELDDVLEGTDGSFVWGRGDDEVFYLVMDEQHRPYRVMWHKMGEAQEKDVCLFEESNEMFNVALEKTTSRRFVVIQSESSESSEVHVIDLHEQQSPEEPPRLRCLQPREEKHLYYPDHWEDHWLIATNKDRCRNAKLCAVPLSEAAMGATAWKDVMPYDPALRIDYVEAFRSFVAVVGRKDGYAQLWILHANSLRESLEHTDGRVPPMVRLPTKDAVYFVTIADDNAMYDTKRLRYIYSSPVAPTSWREYMVSDDPNRQASAAMGQSGPVFAPGAEECSVLLKQRPVPNCDVSLYDCGRIEAPVRNADGSITRVPVSLVWRRDRHRYKAPGAGDDDHEAAPFKDPPPLVLDGYGSYGVSNDPVFQSRILSLLDRGVVYATAHVRGGGEMGRWWYEDEGKYLHKKNTFFDFIACAEHLVSSGWGASDKLAAIGRSAGGLLVGSVLTMRPDLFRVVVGEVPFVDIMATMQDPSIPLTVVEWLEWGNPHDPEYHDYMLSYSPMDNVRDAEYPSVLLTGGLHDPRVAYWEPAKFAARLRDHNKGNNPVLLKIEMGSGHFSASDRYKNMSEDALVFAFLLERLCVDV